MYLHITYKIIAHKVNNYENGNSTKFLFISSRFNMDAVSLSNIFFVKVNKMEEMISDLWG
jgi:hypothetical protein